VDRALAPNLRVLFRKPGFFITDVRFVIMLDGHVVYDGGFLEGVDLYLPVATGPHVVSTRIDLGMIARSREYPIHVPPGQAFSLELEYSRFWGNFTKKPKLVAHA
jgi:hypothetical protein